MSNPSLPPTTGSSYESKSRKSSIKRRPSSSNRRLFQQTTELFTSTCEVAPLQVVGKPIFSNAPVDIRSVSPLVETLGQVHLQSHKKNNKRKSFRPISPTQYLAIVREEPRIRYSPSPDLYIDTRAQTPYSDSDSALLSDQSRSPSRSRSIHACSFSGAVSPLTPDPSPSVAKNSLCRSESYPFHLTIDLHAAELVGSKSILKKRKLAATPMPSSRPHRFFETGIASLPLENKTLILPTLPKEANMINPISASTLADLLRGGYSSLYDELFIIDCRFVYEYQGGHINGAINVMDPQEIMRLLFPNAVPRSKNKRVLIIFHCEFSKVRGPRSANFLRSEDRKAVPFSQFPNVHFPDVYVLKGGYKNFYTQHPEFCSGGYTPMDHPDFRQQEIAMHRQYKALWDVAL